MGRPNRGRQTTTNLDPPPVRVYKFSIFEVALVLDLGAFQPEKFGCWLLQYVDDLLLAAENKDDCWEGTKASLRLLMEAGYRVSKKKARICKEEVRYLGFVLKRGTRLLAYMTTGKTIALTRLTFVGKVMSLLLTMLSRLVITFLPRSKRPLISWLQSPSSVILEPKKIKSDTVSTVSPSISHKVMGPDAMIFVSEC